MDVDCWIELDANKRPKYEEFLDQKLFSDVTLIAKDKNGNDVKFPVSRFVLARALLYFEKMFTIQMKEADAKEIRIEEICADILKQIIRFLYCGKIFLSRGNVKEILRSAEYLAIDFLVGKCIELYTNVLKMDYDLAMEIRNVWRSGCYPSLKVALEKANRYLKANFVNFLHTDAFKQADISDVADILSWNGVCERKEELIFNAANRWLEYDPGNRQLFTEKVFATVRWPQLSKEFLMSNTVCNNQFLKGNEKFEKMIGQTIDMFSNELTDRTASTRHQIEIYVFPSDERKDTEKTIAKFNLTENEWSTMDLPKAITDRYLFDVVPFEQRCFVLGGRKRFDDEMTQKNLIFDPFSENNICREIEAMKEQRFMHCAFAVDNSIYVCGGRDHDGDCLSSVEQFVVNDSRGWMELPGMKQKRFGAASCVLNNIGYVFGGVDENDVSLNSVERFDSRVGEWQNVAPMRSWPRDFGGAALLKGEVYVAGGSSDYGTLLETVELYDYRMDAWRDGPSMSAPRCGLGFVSDGARLFAIGGYDEEESPCNCVEVFDPSLESGNTQWTMGEVMPSNSGHVRAVII